MITLLPMKAATVATRLSRASFYNRTLSMTLKVVLLPA